jgi:hypothetical protein
MTVREALEELERVRRATDDLDRQRLLAVAASRRDGVSWEQIGRALRLTRQSAWERYAPLVDAVAAGWANATLTGDEAFALSREALAEVRRERHERTTSRRR